MDSIHIDGYVEYDQMPNQDRQKVDKIYESYKIGSLDGTSTSQVEYFINHRLNKEVIRQINDKLDQDEYKKNYRNSLIRQKFLEDTLKSEHENLEVTALKKEVSEMKETISELTRLLAEKLA